MIEDHPIDTDRETPKIVSREEALVLLESMTHPEFHGAAQMIWDIVIGPLYDARRASQDWYRGRCRKCFAHHPGMQNPRRFGVPSSHMNHRMHCPKYVGPLDHKKVRTEINWLGTEMTECSCGQRYETYQDELGRVPAQCPDIRKVWRGPRPDPSEESRMTKNEGQEPKTADQQTQDQNSEQSEIEKQRLANLKASGQLQEGEEPQAQQGQQEGGNK